MIAVGLEMSANVVKLAVVEAARGAFKVKAFETHKIDAKKGETENDIVSVVDSALKRLKAPRGQVVTSVRALDCMIREIMVPFTEEDKIRKTVKYQAENYFTSASIDDLIIDYSKVTEIETKSRLMVAGIKKALVDRRLRFLEECSVDPLAIDLDVAALYNTYAHAGVFEGKGAGLIVDVEGDSLKVGVVENGRLRLARALRMRVGENMKLDKKRRGSPSGEQAIYDTAADESARLPVVILDEGEDEAFNLEDSGISETEREGIIHRIFMEIDRTVASVGLSHDVELIALSGASCALEGIETLFTEHFEIEARRIDLGEQFGTGPDEKKRGGTSISLEGGIAIGLALKGLGVDHARMDFRQEEFAYKGTFEQVKRGLATTLTLLFALTFLYAFHLKQELREKSETVGAVKEMQASLFTVLFPSLEDPSRDHMEIPVEGAYYEALREQQGALAARYRGNTDKGAARVSSLEVIRRFAMAKAKLDPAKWPLEVMKISIDPRASGRSQFICTTPQPGAGTELQRAFEEDDLVIAQNMGTVQDKRTGAWQFTMQLELKPTAGEN